MTISSSDLPTDDFCEEPYDADRRGHPSDVIGPAIAENELYVPGCWIDQHERRRDQMDVIGSADMPFRVIGDLDQMRPPGAVGLKAEHLIHHRLFDLAFRRKGFPDWLFLEAAKRHCGPGYRLARPEEEE